MKRRLTMVAACGFALVIGSGCAQEAEPLGAEEGQEREPEAPGEDTDATTVADTSQAAVGDDSALADEADAEEAAEEAEDAQPAMTPEQTCVELANAAERHDAEAFGANVTDAALEVLSQDKKVAKRIMKRIGKTSCGEATMSDDGERATVSATVGKDTRGIPFTLVDGAWKFDGAAYLAQYPVGKKKGKKKRGRRKR